MVTLCGLLLKQLSGFQLAMGFDLKSARASEYCLQFARASEYCLQFARASEYCLQFGMRSDSHSPTRQRYQRPFGSQLLTRQRY
jgi:hypothetical protein